jgi:hypothetical protein
VIAYRATLGVPRELVWFVAELLIAERHRRGTPRGSRALTCFWQAVLGLRWFRDRAAADALARDHGISRATAYRYLDEVILMLAQESPDLREALERARDEGLHELRSAAGSPRSAVESGPPACCQPVSSEASAACPRHPGR